MSRLLVNLAVSLDNSTVKRKSHSLELCVMFSLYVNRLYSCFFFFCHYYTNVKCLHLLLVDIWIVLVFVIDCRCWRIIFWWKETLYILGLYSGVELLGHKSGRLIRWCPHYQTAFMRSCTSFTVPPAVGEGLICAPSSPELCMVFPFS